MASTLSESNSTQTMDEQDTKPPRNLKLLRLVIEGEYKSLLDFQVDIHSVQR